MSELSFNTVEEAIEEIRQGRMVIVVDDEDRENEGDLVMAAEKVEPWHVNFMAMHGRGLICVPLTAERLKELDIPMMTTDNTESMSTAFTVSVDAVGVHTGISAAERAMTIRALVDPAPKPSDLRRPGHIFPLRAKEGGVLRRAGHTEAAVDLARLAGLQPAGVICEIMNEDGTMARVPQLMEFAKQHGLKIITIADLIRYRRSHEKLVERVAEAALPTKYGEFPDHRLPQRHHGFRLRRAGERRGPGRARRPGPGAFGLRHRRHPGFAPLRLRRPARGCSTPDRTGGQGGPGLPSRTRRPRHRPAQQDPGLRPARPRRRYGRSQRVAGIPRRPEGIRDRRPDLGRPGLVDDPASHQQSPQDRGARGVRPERD